jgi:hypothetical protein
MPNFRCSGQKVLEWDPSADGSLTIALQCDPVDLTVGNALGLALYLSVMQVKVAQSMSKRVQSVEKKEIPVGDRYDIAFFGTSVVSLSWSGESKLGAGLFDVPAEECLPQ